MTNLIRFNPHALINEFLRDSDSRLQPLDALMDEVFRREFPDLQKVFGPAYNQVAFPKVDVKEYTDKYVLVADIPSGLTKEDTSIEIQDGILTLKFSKSKEVTEDKSKSDYKYVLKERKTSACQRSFTLDETVDQNPDKIDAEVKDGALHITLKKVTPTKPSVSKIQIKG